MMQWLLKNEGYPPAILVSVLLHALLLVVIFVWNKDSKELLRIEQPAAIVATAVKDNPQRLRQQETKRKLQQQVAQEKARVQEQERQHQETLVKEEVERQKIVQLHKQQEQDQKRKQDEQKQQQQKQQDQKLQDQKQQAVAKEQDQKREKEKQQQAVREEAQRQSDLAKQQAALQRALTEEQQLVANYTGKIRELIEGYWSRPAGARKDTLARVELQLTPTGEIVSSRIVQGSGDENFDRSVLQAVNKAGRFSFLKELDYAIFSKYFRNFSLEFKPGDL